MQKPEAKSDTIPVSIMLAAIRLQVAIDRRQAEKKRGTENSPHLSRANERWSIEMVAQCNKMEHSAR